MFWGLRVGIFWSLLVSLLDGCAFQFFRKQRNFLIAIAWLLQLPGGTAWSSIAVSQKLEIPELPLKRVKHQTYWWLRDISFWWFCCQFTRPYRNTQTYILKGGPNMNISWERQYLHVTASPDLYFVPSNCKLTWPVMRTSMQVQMKWLRWSTSRLWSHRQVVWKICINQCILYDTCSGCDVWATSKGVCTNH